MIICPNCNHQNPEGAVQCEACYTPLPTLTTCPNCGAAVQTDASFCGQCGFDLRGASRSASQAAASTSQAPIPQTPEAYPSSPPPPPPPDGLPPILPEPLVAPTPLMSALPGIAAVEMPPPPPPPTRSPPCPQILPQRPRLHLRSLRPPPRRSRPATRDSCMFRPTRS